MSSGFTRHKQYTLGASHQSRGEKYFTMGPVLFRSLSSVFRYGAKQNKNTLRLGERENVSTARSVTVSRRRRKVVTQASVAPLRSCGPAGGGSRGGPSSLATRRGTSRAGRCAGGTPRRRGPGGAAPAGAASPWGCSRPGPGSASSTWCAGFGTRFSPEHGQRKG